MIYLPFDKTRKLQVKPTISVSNVVAPTVQKANEALPEIKVAEEPNLPPLKTMVKNLTKSIATTAAAIAKGSQVTSTEMMVRTRMAICTQCEYYRHKDNRCSKCGCFTVFKTKLYNEHCPVGKW